MKETQVCLHTGSYEKYRAKGSYLFWTSLGEFRKWNKLRTKEKKLSVKWSGTDSAKGKHFKNNIFDGRIVKTEIDRHMQVPAVSGQVMEVDLDLFMIVGLLEGTAVVIRFDKGLVTTRLRVATFALLVDSVGGWMGTGKPPIQRQIHTEVHQVLMLSFLGGRGWRLGGLPLIGGFWHGQEHTGVVGHGCCDPAEKYSMHEYAVMLTFLNWTTEERIFHLSICKVFRRVELYCWFTLNSWKCPC